MEKSNAGAALPRCPSRSRSYPKTGRIIVAGSDAEERAELRVVLEFEGHEVSEAETADQTLQQTCSGSYHVLILASRIEGMEPQTLCRRIRLNSDLGIIVVGGDDTTQGRIDAWNAGADDYLSAPFVYRELLAQVRAVLRRAARVDEDGPRIMLQDRAIDLQSHQVEGPGSRVSRLTPKEFLVLQYLIAHANMPFTRKNLAQTAWQQDAGSKADYMRSVIRQLRRKLEPDPNNPRYILSERYVGYRFHMPQPVAQSGATEPV
jgi:two-component system KDP operon response regulator KdpE